MPFPVDTYDEREMFGVSFAFVAAFPTPETIAAVMPIADRLHNAAAMRRELGSPPPGHAVRRRSWGPWSVSNATVVSIPDEFLDAHAAEVADVLAGPPARATQAVAAGFFDTHRDAQLGLLRRRIEVDPERWAYDVAHGNEREMMLLAEHTRDWAPWVPLINFAVALRELDQSSPVLRAAEHRLRLIARRLLDAQGFAAVRVDDTLGLRPQIERAVRSLLGS
ncbi:MAG: hypothetical protein AB7S26_30630 [Sandaracinaceae bacterium]